MTQVVPAVGSHLLADFYGVAEALLRDAEALQSVLRDAAAAAGARVLGCHFHRFGDCAGVTGVVLLAESHLSIHTWPESGFAAIDIFMCGRAEPALALAVLLARLGPSAHHCTSIARPDGAMRHVARDVRHS